jgi:SpoVK/Ycf46/Vps4 family AAA+-type ATPase
MTSSGRTYPQIYMTADKLQIDPKIEVTARDFMASMKRKFWVSIN